MPQIERTWRAKLVGALSIPMMCMQSPGAIAMVLSIALRYMSFFSLVLVVDRDAFVDRIRIGRRGSPSR